MMLLVRWQPWMLLVFVVAFSTRPMAQPGNLHSVLKTDSAYLKQQLKAAEDRFKADQDKADGDFKKYIKEIYKERFNYIKSCFDANAIISDPEAVAYLQQLTNEIVQNNPALNALQPRFLLYKAWWPNASSLGDGTILVNIGMIYKVQNEAQLAFILCHELAHLSKNHSEENIQKYVTTYYDKDFQKELKRISKQEYEKNKKLTALEKSISFSNHRHSREKESEADAVAVEYLKNTHYRLSEALSGLAMLDSIDNDKYNVAPALTQYFNAAAFPFKAAWTKEEETFFGGAKLTMDDKIKDSLKTHPDCRKRVQNITETVTRNTKPGTVDNIDAAALRKWQQQYDFEVLAFAYDRDFISLAMYGALQTLSQYPDDPWLLALIGHCWHQLYVAQKKHELSKYADLPSPYQEKKYNDFLVFLQNLSLSDIAQINYHFLESKKEKGLANEDYVYALIQSKEDAGKTTEKEQWLQYYQTHFTNPRYKF